MATPSLALEALHVPFGASPGLVALSLLVAPGERLALLGPSGEGKTSLLRAIAGLAPTQGGRVLVGGRDVTAFPAEQRGAVYLHQVPVLFPHLDVRENVAFPLTVRGASRADRRRAVQPLLERLGLAAEADRRADALSGGQRHRVALARALAARPQVLLLDEPLAALDPALRADVRAAIAEAHAGSDTALVLVTHDLDDAAALGDRVAVLLDRRLAQVAPPATLFAQPASRAVLRFLGQHQELPGTVVSADRADTPLGVLPITPHGLPSGARVHVGVRTAALESVPPDDPATDGVEGEVTALCHRPQGTEALVQVAGVTLAVPVDAALAVHARVRIRARVRSGPFPAFAE